MSEIERLRALLAEATPGPWRARKWPSPRMVEVLAVTKPPIVPWAGFDDSDRTKTEHDANASLIAAAVNVLPALLDVAEAAQAWRAHCDTPMGPDNSEQMLEWAATEYRLDEALRAALARLDGAS
jgi:hypothetical protein